MNNRTALVTGASRGIGRATALTLAKNGYNLIITCKSNVETLLSLQAEIRSFNVECISFTGDHGNFLFGEQLFDFIKKSEMLPHLIVNNAGISDIGLLQDMTESEWNTLWNTNVTSVISICKNAIPIFLSNGGGKIINISSVWGLSGASMETAYSATKGAVNSFTKALAKELAPSNIQVNAIACGIIDTDMNSHLCKEDVENIKNQIPANRIGTPEDIADIVLNISSTSNYMTGQIIAVDGGWI